MELKGNIHGMDCLAEIILDSGTRRVWHRRGLSHKFCDVEISPCWFTKYHRKCLRNFLSSLSFQTPISISNKKTLPFTLSFKTQILIYTSDSKTKLLISPLHFKYSDILVTIKLLQHISL